MCVEREARFHDAIVESGVWGVSILAALRAPGGGLAGHPWPAAARPAGPHAHHPGPQTGVALLDGALATLECRTTDVHPAGDHSIVVGEVASVATEPPADALLYYRGRYETLA